MNPTLKSLKITKLFGYRNIELNFNTVTVIVGKNGLGKTTILKILNALLKQEYCEELELCSSAVLTFSNLDRIEYYSNLFLRPQDGYDFDGALAEITNNYIDNEKLLKRIEKTAFEFKSELKDIHKELMEISRKYDELKKEIFTKNIKSSMKKVILVEPFRIHGEISVFLKSKSKICYISTINMSANSQQNIVGSDGMERNFLDFEIESEIKNLELSPGGKYTKLFKVVMNELYSDSGKKLRFDSKLSIFELKNPEQKISLKSLSSGERQLMYIIAKVANTKGEPTFLLMDEPEISLHLNWQERILDSIKTINNTCQVVLVTHSPGIVMNGYMDSYIEMSQITTDTEK